jgi:hypothetical protein
MNISEALDIVLELASQNTIDEWITLENQNLINEAERQNQAIEIVAEFLENLNGTAT